MRLRPNAARMITSKGSFFTIDQRTWAKVTDTGMNEAAAYLVLAQGTGGNNKATSWSVQALRTYAGISWECSKAAIENLIERGFIRRAEAHTSSRPRYELATFSEWYRAEAVRQPALLPYEAELLERLGKGEQPSTKPHRKRADALLQRGMLTRDTRGLYRLPEPLTDDRSIENLVWLPNTIVTGTKSGEKSPVRRLRGAGNLWAFRLFVDLYHAHNLRDRGGISSQVIWEKFDRSEPVGQQGPYTVWGFKEKQLSAYWTGPLAAHQHRSGKPVGEHPIWGDIRQLQHMGLVDFIPHIFENSSEQAEIIHPYGTGESGEDPVETEIGSAADAAARAMCLPSKLEIAVDDGYQHFCPALRANFPDVQMRGVLRLRYRPHTRRTAAWFADLQQSSGDYVVAAVM
jgi:hypothetical protein